MADFTGVLLLARCAGLLCVVVMRPVVCARVRVITIVLLVLGVGCPPCLEI